AGEPVLAPLLFSNSPPPAGRVDGLKCYSDFFNADEQRKRTVLDALMAMGSPVFGLRPVRALRCATLKVPKPTSCTELPLPRLPEMESSTASTASPAARLEVSPPRVFWTASINSALFMGVGKWLNWFVPG